MRRNSVRPSGNNLAGPSPSLPSCSSPDVPTHLREPPLQSLGLHRAAGAGDVSLVLFALENGQQVNQTIHGISPLHVAACMGFVPVINVLLAYGADVNILKGKDKVAGPGVEGSTPLHFAAANGHLHAVRALLQHGARPQPLDRDMQTPESLASLNQHLQCTTLLKQWIQLYGKEGRIDPAATKSAFLWNDQSLLELTRESVQSRSPHLETDVLPSRESAMPGSSQSSPVHYDFKRRTSIPTLIEKASNPAISIRNALFPSSPSTPRLDELSPSFRIPRISSRASLTNLFGRRGNTQTFDEHVQSDGDPGHASYASSSRLDSFSSRNRSYPKSSTSAPTPPPSIPMHSSFGSPSNKQRYRLDQPASDQHSRSHFSMALASSHLRRLRSNSASTSAQEAERVCYNRARAHSEAAAQEPKRESLPGAWTDRSSIRSCDDDRQSDSSL